MRLLVINEYQLSLSFLLNLFYIFLFINICCQSKCAKLGSSFVVAVLGYKEWVLIHLRDLHEITHGSSIVVVALGREYWILNPHSLKGFTLKANMGPQLLQLLTQSYRVSQSLYSIYTCHKDSMLQFPDNIKDCCNYWHSNRVYTVKVLLKLLTQSYRVYTQYCCNYWNRVTVFPNPCTWYIHAIGAVQIHYYTIFEVLRVPHPFIRIFPWSLNMVCIESCAHARPLPLKAY